MDFGGGWRIGVTMGTRSVEKLGRWVRRRVRRGVAHRALIGLLAAGVWTSGCGGGSGTSPPGEGGSHVNPTGDGNLSINEIMSLNVLTTKDENGVASPWIELYNPTGQDIDLTGYALTDDLSSPRKAVFPTGVVAKAHGTLLLWADQNPGAGPTHVNLFLPAAGGSLGLARPDGSFIDRLSFGAQSVDSPPRASRTGRATGSPSGTPHPARPTRWGWGSRSHLRRPAIRPR